MNLIEEESFKNKRILVTGGMGFIGSHLIKRLLKLGAKIFVIEKINTNNWRLKEEVKKVEIEYIDIRNRTKIQEYIKKIKPEIVFHLAAYGVDSYTQKDYISSVEINILCSINILTSISDLENVKIINIGSCAEYGNYEGNIDEKMPLNPLSIYGKTKACATSMCHLIAKEQNTKIITLRPFGIFGEFEETHKFFAFVILNLLKRDTINLTLCEQKRDYCYVENIIDAMILCAMDNNIVNEIFNVGSGSSKELNHYIELILKEFKPSKVALDILKYGTIPYRKDEMWNPICNSQKIKSMLNWTPRYTLEEGIKNTVKWFKQYFIK